jgi:hypothetical protein
MSCPVNLRILFGGDDDSRKLTLTSIPASVEELVLEIKTAFGLREEFRVQYRDVEFGNEFMNLMETSEIQDKSTLKLTMVQICDTVKVDHNLFLSSGTRYSYAPFTYNN